MSQGHTHVSSKTTLGRKQMLSSSFSSVIFTLSTVNLTATSTG